MGFFSGVRKVGGTIFNFRVKDWFGTDFIVDNFKNIRTNFKHTFTQQQAELKETFDESLIRLNLTETDLANRKKEFKRLLLIFIAVAVLIFVYSLAIAIINHNIGGFFMGLAITLYALSHAFKYHFWLYQINKRKLGCTVREWFTDNS
jgi:intracellular multiplication protein IcmV